MFRHIVDSTGDPDLLYIAEISVQCALATRAYKDIAAYCLLITENTVGCKPFPYSPLDIISHCVGFLSAVAGISKILFPSNPRLVSRGVRVRKQLNLPALPNIESRAVRNCFEHIDERIDDLVEQHSQFELCFMDIDDALPEQILVLKRLNPNTKTIEFLGKKVDVETCYQEIQITERALKG